MCKEIIGLLDARLYEGMSSVIPDQQHDDVTNSALGSRNISATEIGHVDEWAAKMIEVTPTGTPTRTNARSTINI